MHVEMIMPQMGESIVEGTIVKWRKRVGEVVQKDEMILDISTDKVDSEIPSPVSGILAEILAEEGKTVAVKSPIARIAVGETAQAETSATLTSTAPQPPLLEPEPTFSPSSAPEVGRMDSADSAGLASGEKRFLSPVVKKIVREFGLSDADLSKIRGRGENQRITKQDIMDYLSSKGVDTRMEEVQPPAQTATVTPLPPLPAAQPLPQPPAMTSGAPAGASPATDQEIVPMDHVRKRIAEHMIMSKQTSAHVTSVAEVDVTTLVHYRESVKRSFEAREGFPLTYTAFFIEAAARAIKEFPLINASLDQERIILKKSIHIGIAVGLEEKLIVPVIRNADRLNLAGLARALNDLATRARNRQLKPDEVQGGTFSITNIGTFGNLWGTPIINQPQVAILGTGAIKKRPVVINDAIAIRSMMYLSLTYDHRLIDGLYGGRFLQKIVQLLENYKFD